MAHLTLKSERQIQADILNKLIALAGLNDVNAGSVIDILTQAVAQEDFAQYVQMSQLLRLIDIDSLTGEDLDNKAFEFGLSRNLAVKATGNITIQRAATFTKVSTTFYAGAAAPIIGNSTIDVNDASDALYSTSGTLILGRGTNNEEEVAYSIAPVNNVNYWTFTLDAPLTKNHAVEETVILKQGSDETILAGTTVVVPASSTSAEIQFTVDNDTILYAGEEEIANVNVTAVEAGSAGNIAINSISGSNAFPTPPFTGARATNESKFTTGRDRETDDEFRDRLKNHIQSLSKGTKEAILNAIVGLVDPDSAKRVVSANLVLPQDTDTPVKVYIDDGTGFEPSFLSKGFETVISRSTGGEKRLQLDIDPLIKAQVETNNAETYDMSGGSKTLIYTVGIESETIQFDTADFDYPDAATAEEIVVAINDKSTLLEARTSQSGTKVVVMALVDENERMQITGGTSNSILGFPTDEIDTLYLYIDDVLKSKDGQTAFIDSGNQAPYNFAAIGAFPQTLTVVVDGKTANTQTVTFQAADFLDTAAATVAEVIAVINAQLAGATAEGTNNNTEVRITSNTESSSDSKINITGGTINDAANGLNFSVVEVVGVDGDYTLNRELGTIELLTALSADQSVTVGSQNTRGFLRASSAENYAPNNGETLVISVDGGANQTVTFDATFAAGKSAADTATFINLQLDGATASARTIGTSTYLEITTNTYTQGTGSIRIQAASTANAAFGFTLDSTVSNQRPHKAFRQSANAGPFDFAENDSLVVVIDNDIVNNTFSVLFDYDGIVTSGTSTLIFANTTFANVFETTDELVDFYAAFTSGANTLNVAGTIDTVTNPAGSTYRYAFSGLPAGLGNYAAGDIVNISGMQDNDNNGDFIVTAVSVAGNGYIEVTNANGTAEAGSTGSCLLGQRRQITAYNEVTGQITVGVAYTNIPSATDDFVVIPSTINNIVDFMNNTRVTSISLKSVIEGVSNNTKLQISSINEGSDGYIQITGGDANTLLGFETDIYRGLQAYNYYTGLLKVVHKTIYGDDQDLISYPGVGAAGVQFQVLSPTVSELTVNVDVTTKEGTSLVQLENEIESAITGYINNLGVGDDVIIENIRAAVIAIDGVQDVELTTPTTNIAIADNEIARIRSSNIVIG